MRLGWLGRYELQQTGQGLQRMQRAPRVFQAMQALLASVQRRVDDWVRALLACTHACMQRTNVRRSAHSVREGRTGRQGYPRGAQPARHDGSRGTHRVLTGCSQRR